MAEAQTFRSIQHLRAVAALMIVVSHLHLQLVRLGYEGFWPDRLTQGVDLFFVISGFIMVMATRDSTVTPLLFFARRFLRIAPLYYALTLFILLIHFISPDLMRSFVFDARHVISSFAFWPYPNPATGTAQPALIPGWTLNYEMFFYLLFAISMLAGPRRIPVLCAVFLALVALGQAGATSVAARFFTAPLILQFVMGVLLGQAYLRGGGLSPRWSLALVLLGLPALMLMPDLFGTAWNPIASGLVATAIVAGLVWLERAGWFLAWRGLIVLGNASYAIYLIHPLTLSAMEQLWQRLGMPPFYVLFGLAGVTASILAGLLVHLLVELPLGPHLRRLTLAPSHRVAAPLQARG